MSSDDAPVAEARYQLEMACMAWEDGKAGFPTNEIDTLIRLAEQRGREQEKQRARAYDDYAYRNLAVRAEQAEARVAAYRQFIADYPPLHEARCERNRDILKREDWCKCGLAADLTALDATPSSEVASLKRWRYTVNIKNLLDPQKPIHEVARELVDVLRKGLRHEDLDEAEGMCGIIDAFEEIADNPNASVAEFDFYLDDLYDFADSRNIWLGFRTEAQP